MSGFEDRTDRMLPILLGSLVSNRVKRRHEMDTAKLKPVITVDDVDKLDVRVGTIVHVEEVEGSKKLMRLRVDFGDRERTILAGIKQERSDPKEIEGRQALFVVNLEPQRMAGVLSEGMMFDIGYADGITPVLSVPEKPVPNGARAG